MTLTTTGAVEPTQEDGFVRGLSEAVGGPRGEHASSRPLDRLLTPARVIIVVAIAIFALHWIQKSPCQDAAWSNYEQYAKFCYTDVLALYGSERLNQGAVPYFDHETDFGSGLGGEHDEYPVLTGYLMGVIGLPVHAIGEQWPGGKQYQAFYNLNALVLMAFGLAAIAVTIALRRRRPWDAMMFVLAPALVFTATINWDLFAVGLTAFFLYAWARNRPGLAGVMLGLACAAKFYPLFLVGPLVVLALRTNRIRAVSTTVGAGILTWAAVNAPPFLWAHAGWWEFFRFSRERPVDWGSFWYIGANWPAIIDDQAGVAPFTTWAADIDTLNIMSYLLFGLCCLGVLALGLLAPRRPRLAQLAFLVVALFLLTSKVWSQQFVLWLIPLAVLARPRWGAFLVWQAAELFYFFGFYAHLLNLAGIYTMPETGYVYISALRWWGLVFLCAMVVRDIVSPGRDVVWSTYGEDPDGGAFVGGRDTWWVDDSRNWLRDQRGRLREWSGARLGEAVDRVRPLRLRSRG